MHIALLIGIFHCFILHSVWAVTNPNQILPHGERGDDSFIVSTRSDKESGYCSSFAVGLDPPTFFTAAHCIGLGESDQGYQITLEAGEETFQTHQIFIEKGWVEAFRKSEEDEDSYPAPNEEHDFAIALFDQKDAKAISEWMRGQTIDVYSGEVGTPVEVRFGGFGNRIFNFSYYFNPEDNFATGSNILKGAFDPNAPFLQTTGVESYRPQLEKGKRSAVTQADSGSPMMIQNKHSGKWEALAVFVTGGYIYGLENEEQDTIQNNFVSLRAPYAQKLIQEAKASGADVD